LLLSLFFLLFLSFVAATSAFFFSSKIFFKLQELLLFFLFFLPLSLFFQQQHKDLAHKTLEQMDTQIYGIFRLAPKHKYGPKLRWQRGLSIMKVTANNFVTKHDKNS
jgi:uncharacterized protein YhhL (DUF1145 family)